MMRNRRNNESTTRLLSNNGAAYKMSSWWGRRAGEEEGCNNSSSSSTASAQSNTSTRTSIRDDVETAYSNSNNNSIRHLQREQPSMTRNKRFVSSTTKTLPAALISIFIAISIFTGYNIYYFYYFNTPSNKSIDTAVNHLAVRKSNANAQAAILLIDLYLLWK